MNLRANERRRRGRPGAGPADAVGRIRSGPRLGLFRLLNAHKAVFECPVCGYRGPFEDLRPRTGMRRHARCPSCGALERHRLQYVVTQALLKRRDPSQMTMLHVAPEPFLEAFFRQRFGVYETADLEMPGVDHRVDLRRLPFADATFDFVYASHVLEHIREDLAAIGEVRRILRPGGIAVLPVPIVAPATIEYPEPNPNETFHVRAPGPDYFDRYERWFARVERHTSEALPERFQPYVYEDRSRWPTAECPLRPPMPGERHADVVPVCYVQGAPPDAGTEAASAAETVRRAEGG